MKPQTTNALPFLTHIILAIGGVNPNCESDIDDNLGLPAALKKVGACKGVSDFDLQLSVPGRIRDRLFFLLTYQ